MHCTFSVVDFCWDSLIGLTRCRHKSNRYLNSWGDNVCWGDLGGIHSFAGSFVKVALNKINKTALFCETTLSVPVSVCSVWPNMLLKLVVLVMECLRTLIDMFVLIQWHVYFLFFNKHKPKSVCPCVGEDIYLIYMLEDIFVLFTGCHEIMLFLCLRTCLSCLQDVIMLENCCNTLCFPAGTMFCGASIINKTWVGSLSKCELCI